MAEENEKNEEYEALSLRDREDIDAIKLEIQYIQGLVSFGGSETGKILIEERERAVIKHINKLFTYLTKMPDTADIISSIAQLKVAMRDLVDFKGSQSVIEDKQILIDTILKRKG